MFQVPKPAWIAVDLDFTLSHFAHGIDSIMDIFFKRGVPLRTIYNAWQAAEKKGFCLDNYRREVEKLSDLKFDPTDLEYDFDSWLKANLCLYPEVHRVLNSWAHHEIPLVILTFGDPDYQKRKIAALGLGYLKTYIVSDNKAKTTVLLEASRSFGKPVLYIEDCAANLDSARIVLSADELMTVWVKRSDSPYLNNPPTAAQHLVCETLEELKFF